MTPFLGNNSKLKAIVFDFDGVIHNTFGFHYEKVNEFSGASLTEDEFRDVHNGNFFKHGNDKLKGVEWSKYREFIYEDITKLKVSDAVKDTLLILNKKYELFIITSGGKKNISDYLENNGLGKLFKEVLGGELSKSKVEKFNYLFEKYSLTARECIFVTDTLGDILEANEIGIKTLAVDFGYHSKKTLKKGKPYKIISSFTEILKVI